MATLRKASFVRTTGLLKYFALASLVMTAASCGGSDESSESRQRNAAPGNEYYGTTAQTSTIKLGISPDKVVLDDDGNAFVMSKQSSLIQKVTKDGVVSDLATLETNAVDLDIDEKGSVYSLNNRLNGGELEAKLTKFASDGSLDRSLGVPNRLDFVAVTSSNFAVGATEGMNTPVAFDLDTRVVSYWDEFGDVGNDLIGSPAAVVALRNNLNDIMIRRFPAGMSRVETCPGMTDAKVAADGRVYVVCNQSNSIIVVDQKDEKTTLTLNVGSPYAIDVENGISYFIDTPAKKVFTVDSAGVSMELFATGVQPVDIDVNSSGTVVVANRGDNSVTFYTPASTSGGTLEQMPALDKPNYGPTTRTADGFTVKSLNYDANQTYSAITSAGEVTLDGGTADIVVTGLAPGEEATVTVTVNRPGYSSAEGSISESALNAPLTYTFGAVTPTADGFTVPIENKNPDWETKVGLNPSESQASLSDTGLLTVFGVGPDTEVTVDVYSIRRGYLTGKNSVTGRSAPAGQAPESSESEQQQGTPVEEITSSEIPQVDTSSTTTMAENPTTTAEADSTTTTAAEQQGVTAATITSNNTTVAAVPPAAIENSVPVIVPAGTTEITCDDACVDALLTYAGSTGGTVTASVAGAAPVPVEKGSPTALAVGDKDTSIAFTVTGEDGKETVVDLPVVQASQSVVTPAGESDSGSNSAWIWVILVLILLLIVFLLRKRRQNDSATN